MASLLPAPSGICTRGCLPGWAVGGRPATATVTARWGLGTAAIAAGWGTGTAAVAAARGSAIRAGPVAAPAAAPRSVVRLASAATATIAVAATTITSTATITILYQAHIGAVEGVPELCVIQLSDGPVHVITSVKLNDTHHAIPVTEHVGVGGLAHLPDKILEILPGG